MFVGTCGIHNNDPFLPACFLLLMCESGPRLWRRLGSCRYKVVLANNQWTRSLEKPLFPPHDYYSSKHSEHKSHAHSWDASLALSSPIHRSIHPSRRPTNQPFIHPFVHSFVRYLFMANVVTTTTNPPPPLASLLSGCMKCTKCLGLNKYGKPQCENRTEKPSRSNNASLVAIVANVLQLFPNPQRRGLPRNDALKKMNSTCKLSL